MSEVLNVYRATYEEDEYGDPQPTLPPAQWPLWKTFSADMGNFVAFAPSNPSEALDVGRNAVIKGGVVYVRGLVPTGILATDQVEVAGQRFAVDGAVGPWTGYSGYKGDQFAVKATTTP